MQNSGLFNASSEEEYSKTVKLPPGVKGRPILEGAVVVVAHKVSRRRPAGAALGCLPHHHHHVVFGVEHVDQQHLKHQRGLRRDETSC